MRISDRTSLDWQSVERPVESKATQTPVALPTNDSQISHNTGTTAPDSRKQLRQAENSFGVGLKLQQVDQQLKAQTPSLGKILGNLAQWVKPSAVAMPQVVDAFSQKATKKASTPGSSDVKASVDFIRQFNKNLGLDSSDLQQKLQNMSTDTHTLLGAMPTLFYKDIAGGFASQAKLLDRPAPQVMIQGDMHLFNFGSYRGEDGHAAWGICDFDKSEKGSPEWDLDRLSTSITIKAREAGLSEKAQKSLVESLGTSYFKEINKLAKGNDTPTAYINVDEAKGPVKDLINKVESNKQKDLIGKFTTTDSKGNISFVKGSGSKLVTIPDATKQQLLAGIKDYQTRLGDTPSVARPLNILDIAQKPDSGGSSFGLPRYYALVANADPTKAPRILEIKQTLASPVIDQTGDLSHAKAQNIVDHQHLFNGNTDPLLGAFNSKKSSFLVRELEKEKDNVDPVKLSLKDFQQLVSQAGEVLARAHGRTPDQAKAIDDWVGNDSKKAVKHMADFGTAYANQMEADRQELARQVGQ